ncbi:MAG: tRNA dihydrouridine synthase DusB [Paludibacteraceae bacterium]|nr:tRNA dihydrouridine synthase DusB [Paludibacteraceae bacterium]
MKIAHIEFPEKPLFLAPMEDVTDPAFRLLCKQYGADMVYSEFVSADALVRSVKRTAQKLTIYPQERPVAIQIYGRDPETMAEAAQIVAEAKPDIIDINFGCPVKKVAGKGAGAGLLNNVPLLLKIAEAVVKAVDIPVTAKTRLGWDDEHKIITELALQLQDTGIQALAIHGRTRAQMYKGEADWTLIGEVKNNPQIHIPIIGNGDITTPQQAVEAFNNYGVDAVMVGRGSIGQPWIFSEMKAAIKGITPTPISYQEQVKIIKQHVLNSIEWLGDEHKGIVHSRRHLAATPIFKGIRDFKSTRIAMLRAETLDELFSIIDSVENMR